MSLHYTVSDNAYVRLGLGTRLGGGGGGGGPLKLAKYEFLYIRSTCTFKLHTTF